ncbi:MAG: RtcB family protein [Planctomycetes bacterium]|nr:RtcB family protein [Planctomycetota bacterium]
MHVDGIVYAREDLLPDLREDRSLEQVANVATLPGIVGHSFAMPDIHWGYGFPIGGVAAFDPDAGGVVTPGGIGFDINCLAGDTRVTSALGYTRPLRDLVEGQVRDPVTVFDLDRREFQAGAVAAGLARRPRRPVFEVETAAGRRVVATDDHPFLTPTGMRDLGALVVGDRVATHPFEGVPYEPPAGRVIVSRDQVREVAVQHGKGSGGNGLEQALRRLDDLLPLTDDHPALPVLLKVAGYVLGDGTIFTTGTTLKAVAYGAAEDLERMRGDLRPWFRVSSVHSRPRRCAVATRYGTSAFTTTEHSLALGKRLALLLAAMGLPTRRRVDQDWGLPRWLDEAPRWQQRLFLAGFFGAELSAPTPVPEQGTCFQAPVLCQNKREPHVASGRRFLEQVGAVAARFGVRPCTLSEREEYDAPDGSTSIRLRLIFPSTPDDLIALWGRIGFEYNASRTRKAAAAVGYLRAKLAALGERRATREQALDLRRRHGWSAARIHAALGASAPVNLRFVERTIHGRRGGQPDAQVRVAERFPRLDEWLEEATFGLGDSGAVWDEVVAIRPRADVDRVYDITVDHPSHDFVAEGVVVHNCGVRLLASDLHLGDVKPRLKELTRALFDAIPSGVGSTRPELHLDDGTLSQVLERGLDWAVEQGYATDDDRAHVEETGRIPGADPAAVSHRARQRGRDQLGTLGSGNHFAEVGVVDEVHDEATAAAYGLRLGQITLMIHSGSRGLGHQVCEDSLSAMLAASAAYDIPLVDRQLCCAPIDSPEARRYLGAMASAANFAFTNRQVMTHWARLVFKDRFRTRLRTVYDVCHNIAKFEEHPVDGQTKRLLLHRKGATRALPPGHPLVPEAYRALGQPVIIPGDMGRYSFVLKGGARAEDTFGSACHGAGRLLSRSEAKRRHGAENVTRRLEETLGIIVLGASRATVVEEVPEAYKDVAQVVDVVHQGGLAEKVARIRPLGVVKG